MTEQSRYYAHTALGSIHRSLAIQEWHAYQASSLTLDGLERALAAFDMFVIHGDEEDMDEVRYHS